MKFSTWKNPFFILCLLALIIAVTRLQTFHEVIERDQALYAIIANQMLRGDLLYTQLVENKPPAIFVAYAAVQKMLGMGALSLFVLGLLPAWVTLVGIYKATLILTRNSTSAMWAAVFWTFINRDLATQANQPNTEVFVNACVIWSFCGLLMLCQSERRSLGLAAWTGILLAAASLFKTVVVIHAVLFAGVLIVVNTPPNLKQKIKRSVAQSLTMLCSAGFIWIVIAGYFYSHHRFDDFIDVIFRFNKTYAGGVLVNILVGLKPMFLFPAVIWSLMPLILASLLGFWRCRSFSKQDLALSVLLVSTLGAIALPGKFYPHYYQYWLPVLCVSSMWGVERIARENNWRPTSPVLAGMLMTLGLLIFQLPALFLTAQEWTEQKYPGVYGQMLLSEEETAQKINALLREDETFYHWGVESQLFYYSKKMQPNIRFRWFLTNPPLGEKLTATTLRDLQLHPPEIVVMYRDPEMRAPTNNPIYDLCMKDFELLPEKYQVPYFELYYRKGGRLEQRMQAVL